MIYEICIRYEKFEPIKLFVDILAEPPYLVAERAASIFQLQDEELRYFLKYKGVHIDYWKNIKDLNEYTLYSVKKSYINS